MFCKYINDRIDKLQFGKLLLYVDGVKKFTTAKYRSDALCLLSNRHKSVRWFNSSGLIVSLNISKCYLISFVKARSPLLLDYYICSDIATRVSRVLDMGVIFDSRPSFDVDLEFVISKISKLIRFIEHTTSCFTGINSIIYLTPP